MSTRGLVLGKEPLQADTGPASRCQGSLPIKINKYIQKIHRIFNKLA